MRNTSIVLLFLTMALNAAAPARANSTCSSVLTADQLRGLNLTIFPGHPYSPWRFVDAQSKVHEGEFSGRKQP